MISGGSSACSASAAVSTMSGVSTAIVDCAGRSRMCSMLARSSGSSLGSVSNQRVEDLAQDGLRGRPQAERQHVGVVPGAARRARSRRRRRARRARPGTLLAAIEAPVPVQQQTIPCSARPSATSRAASSHAHAQSARSPRLERAVRDRLVAALAQLVHEPRAPGACPCRLRPRPSSAVRLLQATAQGEDPSSPVATVSVRERRETGRMAGAGEREDATRVSDISYYRESRARQAARRPRPPNGRGARGARR